jgi:hypothetical protein
VILTVVANETIPDYASLHPGYKPDPAQTTECGYTSADTADFHFAPFVVETSKILIMDVGYARINLEGEDTKTDSDHFKLRACVVFDTATPARFNSMSAMGLNLTHKIEPGEFITASSQGKNTPVALISRKSSVFSE